MKFSALSYISSLALGVLFAGMVSCSDEIVAPVVEGEQLRSGGINFRCAEMLEVNYGAARSMSRAGASKDPDEKAVKTLHVFFFNKEGEHELLTPNYVDFSSYIFTQDGGFLTLPETADAGSLFKDDSGKDVDDVIVVALANIDATDDADDPTDEANRFRTKYTPNGKIQKSSREAGGEGYMIEKLADLEEWVYYPRMRMDDQTEEGDVQGLPAAGMPMICIGQPLTLKRGADSKAEDFIVNMVAMMAKVNVDVRLVPDQSTSQYPTLEITEYGVRNMPVAVPFKAPTGSLLPGNDGVSGNALKDALATPGNFDACKTLFDVTTQPMYHKGGTGQNSSSDSGDNCDPLDHEFVHTLATPRIINKDSAPVRFTYYTYENINVPDYGAERANGEDAFVEDASGAFGLKPSYPEGVEGYPDEYQRWKSTFSYSHRASALVLKGTYTNHQGMHYKAQFTVYLGADADMDFTVKRNHQYDNRITIRGLEYIRNSTDDVYTFDGRVNVVDDNPFYLAVVNERNVDAHASALPMDVWLMYREPENTAEYYSEVTVEIPENAQDWVQMVMVPRAEMEKGNFEPGTGCEPYFYTNLLNDIKNNSTAVLEGNNMGGVGYPGHEPGAQCGSKVVITSTPANAPNAVNNSRARVYFYIDENTTITDAEATQMLTTPNLKDRMVTVDITYRRYTIENGVENTLETRRRTLDIEQRGLRRVPATWNGTNGDTDDIPETYIEYTEEYLNHNDPLEHHLADGELYEGLEWGLSNIGVNRSSNYSSGFVNNYDSAGGSNTNGFAYNIYKKNSAMAFTQWAIEYTRTTNPSYPMSDIRLYNNSQPASAFHYCYGKNKRNYDGSVLAVTVPTTGSNNNCKGWYMPGIRELETALVKYYEEFADFQGNLYWSCACGPCPYRTILFISTAQPNEIDNNYARATKVNNNGTYINSGIGDDGYLPRVGTIGTKSAVNRIRAFYRRN